MEAASKLQTIEKADLRAITGQPFNPPVFSDTFTKDDFYSEYWSTHSAITEALSILGTQSQLEGGDFCANDDWGYSRFIGIELSSRRLWRPELVPLVQTVLLKRTQAYVVYFDHDLLDEPEFYFLVQPTTVVGYMPTAVHRRAFSL